jgi:Ser/Thr protein kinase RdoA (MazF antagonist)
MALRLTDGRTIGEISRPLQGTRHRVVFGVEESSGREVAVKIELVAGALEPERRALEWLTRQGGPSPRLHATGTLSPAGENPRALCLVIERVAGEPASSLPGWEGLGRALARLSRIPWQGSGLTTLGRDDFLALHELRVEDLGQALGRDLGAGLPPVPPSYPASPLAMTHGDPGPGNFLDDGADGTLIDWEDALVAPRGLDLGRAAFIALLGSGPEGFVARDHAARADAVVRGHLAETDGSPDQAERDWWLSVAGVQFAHRRLERSGHPGVLPWIEAVKVLESTPADPPRNRP